MKFTLSKKFVCLVKNYHLHSTKSKVSLFEQLNQSTRSSDDDVRIDRQTLKLPFKGMASQYESISEVYLMEEAFEDFSDLVC